jgi:hypothetical protein
MVKDVRVVQEIEITIHSKENVFQGLILDFKLLKWSLTSSDVIYDKFF